MWWERRWQSKSGTLRKIVEFGGWQVGIWAAKLSVLHVRLNRSPGFHHFSSWLTAASPPLTKLGR